jgi:hypothetical protein
MEQRRLNGSAQDEGDPKPVIIYDYNALSSKPFTQNKTNHFIFSDFFFLKSCRL